MALLLIHFPSCSAFQPRMLRILSEMEKLSTLSGNQYDEPAYGEQLEREYPNYRVSHSHSS